VGVLQFGGGPDLVEKAFRPKRGCQLGVKQLERHRPVMPEIVSQVHRGHAPTSEFALDAVAVGQSVLETGDGIAHGL
jgi:hypothetical protein